MLRKDKKYHFIYKTTNLLSGRYYIGMHSTNDLEDGYLGSGNRLRRAIKKHGKQNFVREILEFCETRELLIEKEAEVVNLEEIAKKDCMNLKVGGNGGFKNEDHRNKFIESAVKMSTIHEQKIKEKRKWLMDNDKEWVKFNSDRIKIGLIKSNHDPRTFLNKKHSEKTKKKISESMKGKGAGEKNSQYGTCWVTNGGENKKIKKIELDVYISKGWVRGRKI